MKVKELLAKGLLTLSLRSLGAGLLFASTLIFARLLGAEDFGLYSLALTIVTISAVISRVGMDNVVLKQVAVHLDQEPEISKGYLIGATRLTVVTGIIISLLVYFFSPIVAVVIFEKPNMNSVLALFSLAIVPMALLFVYGEAFKSYGNTLLAIFGQSVLAPAITLIILGIFFIYGGSDLEVIVVSIVSGFILASILFNFYARKITLNIPVQSIGYISLLNQGWPMLLASSGALVMSWSDMIVLGVYANESELGIYSAASRTVLVTSLILIAMNSITAPKYAAYYKNNDLDGMKKLSNLSSKILLLLVSIPCMVLAIFPEEVMGLFGSEFIIGATILIILTVGQFVNVVCGSVGYLLSMTGKEHTLKNIILITALVNIALSLALVGDYGASGVAVATVFSVIMWNVWSLIEVKKHLGFWVINPFFTISKINGK